MVLFALAGMLGAFMLLRDRGVPPVEPHRTPSLARSDAHSTAESIPVSQAAPAAPAPSSSSRPQNLRAEEGYIESVSEPLEVIEEPTHAFKLNLTEELLAEMEQQEHELKSALDLEEENEGWRVRLKRPNDLLERAGFVDGDLITFLSIEKAGSDPQQRELAERFIGLMTKFEE